MHPNFPLSTWLALYPGVPVHPFHPVKFTVSAYCARVVKELGGGSRSLGLVRMFARHRESAIRYATAARGSLIDDPGVRMACPRCAKVGYTDYILRNAHCRSDANPLGVYGCVTCCPPDDREALAALSAQRDPPAPPPRDLADLADLAGPVDDPWGAPTAPTPASIRDNARRLLSVSTPEPAAIELYRIHHTLPGAYRALIRLHIELSGPPPVIRRLAGVNPTATLTTQE